MNKDLKMVLISLLTLLMIFVYYRMFIAEFDQNAILKYKVILVKRPEYHHGGVRQSPSWWFRTRNMIFELKNLSPVDISRKEIFQLKKNDSLTIYSYNYYSIPSFFDFLNTRTEIMGIESKAWKKFSVVKVKNYIRDVDQRIFWSLNFIVIFTFIITYFPNKKDNKKEIIQD